MNQALRSGIGSDWRAYTRVAQRRRCPPPSPQEAARLAFEASQADVTDWGLWLRYCEAHEALRRIAPVFDAEPASNSGPLLDLFALTESGLGTLLAGPAPAQWASGPEFEPREDPDVPGIPASGEY